MAQVVGNPHHGKQGGARSLGFGILSIFVPFSVFLLILVLQYTIIYKANWAPCIMPLSDENYQKKTTRRKRERHTREWTDGLEVMVHKECDKQQSINSLGPGRFECNFRWVISN